MKQFQVEECRIPDFLVYKGAFVVLRQVSTITVEGYVSVVLVETTRWALNGRCWAWLLISSVNNKSNVV